jgi:hypothetical protein
MPARIYDAIRRRDSIARLKENALNMEKRDIKAATDTTGIEEEDNSEGLNKLRKSEEADSSSGATPPLKKDNKTLKYKPEALLPQKQKQPDSGELKK